MTATKLPRDANRHPIQCLGFKDGTAQHIAPTSGAAIRSAAFAENTLVISFFTTEPVYLKFGDDTVTATNADHYIPALTEPMEISIGTGNGPGDAANYSNLSVLAVSTTAAVYISEKG